MATEKDILQDAQEKFDYMWTAGSKYRKTMKKAYGFYVGGKHQWEKADLDKLKGEDRPPISLNIVGRQVNILYGLERQNRTDPHAKGVGGEDDPLALLLTGLLKYEDRNDRIGQVLARVKKDGNICGSGWVDIDTVKGRDFLKENRVGREHPGNVLKDPDGKEYDQSDWGMMGRQKWYRLGKLKSMFPERLKNIKQLKDLLDYSEPEEYFTEGTDRSERGGDVGTDDNIFTAKYIDEFRKSARAVEIWTREFKKIYFAVSDARDPKVIETGPDLNTAELAIAKLNQIQVGAGSDIRFGVRSRMEPRIYHDLFSGRILLEEHVLEPERHRQFPLVQYLAYMEEMGDGTVENYGIVFNLEDPQKEKNKRRSMAQDILSRAPLLGGIFKGSKKNEEIVRKMSTTGGWHSGNPDDFREFGGKYLGVLGNVGELEDRAEKDSEDMYVNRAMMGLTGGAKESGVLNRQKVFQGTLGVQELDEHFDMTKYRAYSMIAQNIQQYWTPTKMLKAVGEVPGFDPEALYQAATLLASEEVLDMDIRIDDGENSPSARAFAFQSMQEAAQYSKDFPIEAIVEASPWVNKKFILEKIRGNQEQQQLAEMVGQSGST